MKLLGKITQRMRQELEWRGLVLRAAAFLFTVYGIYGVLVTSFGVGGGDRVRALPAPAPVVEWTMPARFEGQGAFTLGCALWEAPMLVPYGPDNPNEEFAELNFGLGRDGRQRLAVVIDGPLGTAFISGMYCAISVDWSAFPKFQRGGN